MVYHKRYLLTLLLFLIPASACLAATYTVTSADEDGPGTLRQAITDANGDSEADVIAFSLPPPYEISVSTNLPAMSQPVTIDGSTQAGFTGPPLVSLVGAGASEGLVIETGGCQVRCLNIRNFTGAAITIRWGAENSVTGCWLGLDASGENAVPNNRGIILQWGTTDNTIGGLSGGDRNVISGNTETGIHITDWSTSRNKVLGNIIGLNAAGTKAVPNRLGVAVCCDASDNVIGSTAVGGRNIISGNYEANIQFDDRLGGNVISGNYIGTTVDGLEVPIDAGMTKGVELWNSVGQIIGPGNVIAGHTEAGIRIGGVYSVNNRIIGNWIGVKSNGTEPLPNGDGIKVDNNAHDNTIGGTSESTRNIISGNSQVGVRLNGPGVTGNVVCGNYIGLDPVGENAVRNGEYGVAIQDRASGNTIGGTQSEARNVISGNQSDGVRLENPGTTANVVSGNYIGLDATGSFAVSNEGTGISVTDQASRNTFGGTASGTRNYISGNKGCGIFIDGIGTTSNVVQGNVIGLEKTGLSAVPNENQGVVVANGAVDTLVGGTAAGAGNIISGNNSHGIEVSGRDTARTIVQGNTIGLNVPRNVTVGNNGNGIMVSWETRFNLIGGTAPGAGNLVTGNSSGIHVEDAHDNVVQGNLIGTDPTGRQNLGAGWAGVNIAQGSQRNIIGGAGAGERNIIVGGWSGVALVDSGTAHNVVRGNHIGVDITGNIILGGGDHAVNIREGAHENDIGGPGTGDGNIIAGYGGNGVVLAGNVSPVRNRILRNSIRNHNLLGIDLEPAGVTRNDARDSDTGPNMLQNYPVLTSAAYSAGNIDITGTLNSVPSTTFRLEFFNNALYVAGAYGQGEVYLGSQNVTTDAFGNAAFNVSLPAPSRPGAGVTATATDSAGNTSEFSLSVKVADLPVESSLVVTNVYDSGEGSLRQAILDANARAGLDTITFNIPGGLQQIAPVSPLPPVTESVVIDGTTQPGFTGTPLIVLGGWSSGNCDGLVIQADSCVIKALNIEGYARAGIVLESGGNTVTGCQIGIDPTGIYRSPCTPGILVQGDNNIIGGSTAAERNVISGNNSAGILLDGAAGTMVTGNFIGPDPSGMLEIANLDSAVQFLNGANNNVIGGLGAGQANLISGNYAAGVELRGPDVTLNTIQGNYIGVDVTGVEPLANHWLGVRLCSGAHHNTVSKNVISGNWHNGVEIADTGSDGNSVLQNVIGLCVMGDAAIPNNAGVVVRYGKDAVVGGNTISGNINSGIELSETSANRVYGNLVGTDVTGSLPLGNMAHGIVLLGASHDNVIGGLAPGDGNIVSASGSSGIQFYTEGNRDNLVQGNIIGLDITGTKPLGNAREGISLCCGASNNTIGGTVASARNVISGNYGAGVGDWATNTRIQGNYIGTDVTGATAVGNAYQGAYLNSTNPMVLNNVVSGNMGGGIVLQNSSGGVVQGNHVGTNAAGTAAVGNYWQGIGLFWANSNHVIGGSLPGQGNLVSGNFGNGVQASELSISNVQILGNRIGVQADGVLPLPNRQNGIECFSGVTGVTIGGTAAGAGNTVAFNGERGVWIRDGYNGSCTGIAVRGNSIHSNTLLGIDIGPEGVTPNDNLDADTGSNGLQNFPVLTKATLSGGQATVTGTMNSKANTVYAVDFFSGPACTAPCTQQGAVYLGSTSVTTDAAGSIPVSATVPCALPAGSVITATATSPTGDTSEFSAGVNLVDFKPVLAVTNVAVDDSLGNNNGVIDYNECVKLTVTFGNTGATDATGVTTGMSVTTSGVTVVDASAPVPDIPAGGTRANTTPYKIGVSPLFVCGTPITGTIQVTCGQGVYNVPFAVATGTVSSPITYTATGPVAIPDGDLAGVDLPISVSGLSGTLADVTVALYISHTWDSDLDISLIGPDGTKVALASGRGGSGDKFGADCPAGSNDTIFDDTAANSIATGTAPFTGSFRPEQPLSAFYGKAGAAVNGTWKLHVVDVVSTDAGTIECASVTIRERTCSDGGGTCSGTFIYGDANGDGLVNADDVKALLKAVGGLARTKPMNGTADISIAAVDTAPKPSADPRGFGDGKLTMADVARLIRHLNGKEPVYP